MKKLLLISFVITFLLSCRKEINSVNSDTTYLSNVVKGLKDSLSDNDYTNIDIAKSVLTKATDEIRFLKIPFKGHEISADFVLLQTNSYGVITVGFIINLNKSVPVKGKEYEYNGFIKISSLDRKWNKTSRIINGSIRSNSQAGMANKPLVVPAPKDSVIIITTGDIPSDGGGITYSDWISISGISGYYGSYNGSYNSGSFGAGGAYLYGGGGRYSGSTGYGADEEGPYQTEWDYPEIKESEPTFTESDLLLVDFEFAEDLSPIDVMKLIKCFSNIPDEGSTCSIEILTDIPVDKDPNKLLNWQTQSPGHTFLQIKKTNGNSSVMQNIGFYPMEGWKNLLTTGPVSGKFVDNGEHEFNASLKMDLTPKDLKKTLDKVVYLTGFVKYDIDEFNCTDFALDVFNATRISNPLEIPRYDIPGGTAINGTNTPQGLYNKLNSMQQQGIESANITIPGVKGWVASSDGPCN